MQILVTRDKVTANSTTSILSIDGIPIGFALEPANPIPAGEYECWLRWSDHNKHWVIAVMNVPGHTDIEIHSGNVPRNTLDCLLPGVTRDVDYVGNSRVMFLSILGAILKRIPAERVTVKYEYANKGAIDVHNATA